MTMLSASERNLIGVSMEERCQLFLAILSAHRGLSLAISVADMACRLGFGRDKGGQRRAQLVKAAVVEAGHLVGSSCGSNHGWFQPETEAEVQATLAQYVSRIRSLARLIRQTKGSDGFRQYLGQLQIELDTTQEVRHA